MVPSRKFRFRAAPILASRLCNEFLSERSRRSILPSEWVRVVADPVAADADVYICEAYYGASREELRKLFGAISEAKRAVLLMWTDDGPFLAPDGLNLLTFELCRTDEQCCTYGWDVDRYGPALIPQWKGFAERPILASFVGAKRSHACRELLFDPCMLDRNEVVIKYVDWWEGGRTPDVTLRLEREYGASLADSKFVFCPRGWGPSSKRRWEAAYSGAIPILIDDLTLPWGIDVPSVRFMRDPSLFVGENAKLLLSALESAIPDGPQLQDSLRTCLINQFDAPRITRWHTGVRHIVDIANRAWEPHRGFVDVKESPLASRVAGP